MMNSQKQEKAQFGREADPWKRKKFRGQIVARALLIVAISAPVVMFYALSRPGPEVEHPNSEVSGVEPLNLGGAEGKQSNPGAIQRPALNETQAQILYGMAKASMRPYNCNLDFDDDTAAQYGKAFYQLVSNFESRGTLDSAQKASENISCDMARWFASEAWTKYRQL